MVRRHSIACDSGIRLSGRQEVAVGQAGEAVGRSLIFRPGAPIATRVKCEGRRGQPYEMDAETTRGTMTYPRLCGQSMEEPGLERRL